MGEWVGGWHQPLINELGQFSESVAAEVRASKVEAKKRKIFDIFSITGVAGV